MRKRTRLSFYKTWFSRFLSGGLLGLSIMCCYYEEYPLAWFQAASAVLLFFRSLFVSQDDLEPNEVMDVGTPSGRER